jgi:hypothetical protein
MNETPTPRTDEAKLRRELIGGSSELAFATCVFCDQPRRKKPSCEKQTWMVCKDHFEVKCPECEGRAYWMEGMKKGNYYLCFQSLACWWRGSELPNDQANKYGAKPL